MKGFMNINDDTIIIANYNEIDIFPKVEHFVIKNNLPLKIIYGVKVLMLVNELIIPITIVVRNQTGLKNLYKIISLIKAKNLVLYQKQVITKKELIRYNKGLLFGLNILDMNDIYNEISDEDITKDMMWYDFILIDENKLFLNKQEYLKHMITLAKKSRKMVIFPNQDEKLKDLIFFNNDLRKVLISDNAKLINLVDKVEIIKDKIYFPKINNSQEIFIKRIYENAHHLYGKKLPQIVEKRIKEELYGNEQNLGIINTESESIYLIYQDLVLKSNQLGYPIIPRGYVASSLLAYLIGITNINPLASHYHCLTCSYSEFNDTNGKPYSLKYACGLDMPNKKCPNCQTLMIKDGFNLSYELFLGYKKEIPTINLNFASKIQHQLQHYLEKKFGIKKILYAGVKSKKGWGIHPGNLFLIPKELNIYDFTAIAYPCDNPKFKHLITYLDYHDVKKHLMPFNILGHPILDKIKKLQEQTNINMNDIPLNNPEIFNVFKNAQTDNFLAFSKPLTKDLLKKRKPSTFKELINILGIVFDEGNFSQKILFKEDLYHYFIQKKIPKNMAYKITKFISNGYQKDNQDVWKQYQKTLKDYHIDDQFIEQCQNIKYLVSKAHCLSYLIFDVQLAWYKINFPKIFQKIMSE